MVIFAPQNLFTHHLTQTIPNMSKKLFILPALILGAMVIFAPACGDKCEKKDCGFGICEETDGSCNCDPGYEYDADGSCKVESRTKFIGNWTVNETCSNSGAAAPYPVGISGGSDISGISMLGFYGPTAAGGFVAAVKATVEGNTVTIARQQPDNDKIYVEGSGTIDVSTTPNKITMSYKVTDETGATIVTNQCNNVIFTKN